MGSLSQMRAKGRVGRGWEFIHMHACLHVPVWSGVGCPQESLSFPRAASYCFPNTSGSGSLSMVSEDMGQVIVNCRQPEQKGLHSGR